MSLHLCLVHPPFSSFPSTSAVQRLRLKGNKREAWHTPRRWWGPQRWHWCLLLAESSGGTQPWVPGSPHGGPGGRALVCLALWQPLWDQEAQLRWAPLLAPAPAVFHGPKRGKGPVALDIRTFALIDAFIPRGHWTLQGLNESPAKMDRASSVQRR